MLPTKLGKFGSYVEAFFDTIGRERCFVSLFDDLVADPEGQYRAMCDFAGIEPFAGTDFSARRESRGFRYGWLQRLLKRPPSFARDYLAGKKFAQRERSLDAPARDDQLAEKIFSGAQAHPAGEPHPLAQAPDPGRGPAGHPRPPQARDRPPRPPSSAATFRIGWRSARDGGKGHRARRNERALPRAGTRSMKNGLKLGIPAVALMVLGGAVLGASRRRRA